MGEVEVLIGVNVDGLRVMGANCRCDSAGEWFLKSAVGGG